MSRDEYDAACRAVAHGNDAPAHRCSPVWVARQIADELLKAGYDLGGAIDVAHFLRVELETRCEAAAKIVAIKKLSLGIPETDRLVPRHTGETRNDPQAS